MYTIDFDSLDKYADLSISSSIKDHINDSTIIVCIGTDRCIADCLGPLVGHILKERNFPLLVLGCLDDPIHALNLEAKLNNINILYKNRTIIGIDACLGETNDIGKIFVRNSPISPGRGIGRQLPHVGDISILGVVDNSHETEPLSARNIRLGFIMNMAKTIARSIELAYKPNNILKIQNEWWNSFKISLTVFSVYNCTIVIHNYNFIIIVYRINKSIFI